MTKMKFMSHFFLLLGASSFHLYGSPRPYFLSLNTFLSLILMGEYINIPIFLLYYTICEMDAGWQDSMTTCTLSFLSLRCQVSQGWFSLNIWAFYGQNTAHENSFVPRMNHFLLEKYWFIPKMGQLRHLFSFGLLYLPSLPS